VSIRRLVSFVRDWRATRPRLTPFLPLVLRHMLRRGRGGVPELPRSIPSVERERSRGAAPTGDLVVFSVIRNGITNGYPFVEAYGSWLDVAGRILVLDGESDDGTRAALDALASLDPRIEIESRPWPATTHGGGAIAEFTNTALALAAPSGGRLMYVQADEIYTPEQRHRVAGHHGGPLEFAGCVNFWNSFDTVVANEFPMRYVRLFRPTPETRSVGDGFSFATPGEHAERTGDEILHYGWCFPTNILLKHMTHARLYRDHPGYVVRGVLARMMLEQGRTDRRLLDALLPQYKPMPFSGEHPASVLHLLRMDAYDAAVGLQLLSDGASW
jgi:hypothetical protein